MRKFKKEYNRSIPLMAVEYWHNAETKGLLNLTEGKVAYTPLYLYQAGNGTDVYYDVVDWATEEMIVPYFSDNPAVFEDLAKKYLKQCEQIEMLTASEESACFKKLFQLISHAWPMLSILIPLGKATETEGHHEVCRKALDVREKTANVIYAASDKLLKMAQQIVPEQYKQFANVLRVDEVIQGKYPEIIDLKKRLEGYIFFDDHVYTSISLEDFARKKNFMFEHENHHIEVDSIKGSVAMKGYVQGIVRVVKEEEHLNNVQEGDILVSPMTTTVPDCLLAMKRAAAFITDEGGITCHAAIVARELKKPCVIGTKIATRVLKDGDFVEVDANSGVIKKIH